MKSQRKTEKSVSFCPVSAQSSQLGISRTKVAYWKNRVEKVTSKSGQTSPDYSVRIVHRNRRVRFPLRTSNKDNAASLSAKIYGVIVAEGWDAALEQFKPEAVEREALKDAASVGDFIQEVRKYSTTRQQSFQTYVQAFRKIVAWIHDIEKGQSTKAVDSSIEKTWKKRVDAVLLRDVTSSDIHAWKRFRLDQAMHDPASRRRAEVTVNSQIRNAKALFSKQIIPLIAKELVLPEALPFDGVTIDNIKPARYQSKMDVTAILRAAEQTLRKEEPEAYKVFLLALYCGLRASEIDHLLWERFDFKNHVLHVEDSQYHRLKSHDSAGEIDLCVELARVFKEFSKTATGEFVIESKADPSTNKALKGAYRCQTHFQKLVRWLRSQGVTARKPIHELRKEVGAIIASEQGIYAASRHLRHGDIQITAAIYADKKQRIIPRFELFNG
ncbi:tyrosine-type recombinase/integrase [Luteolibacter pohnpeiensis]|uniref:Tyrosine-type recombinase/integrase n=1 Tax=Luteolibacter pohnpeiensis TaxID=454153 RepID=A0A934S9E4_9BACT|nr:tyrosine-type recombinase/integrase [Luteolibacter pohnpeiensis]MBK1883785.1 tyrosine-type recombinase/integrase [Luteolibacter pohnpeiensis]